MTKTIIILAAVGVFTASVLADSIASPDEPLTLREALEFSEQSHPSDRSVELDFQLAQESHQILESGSRLDLKMLIVPQRVDRVVPGVSNSEDDSYARLQLTHPIYDFGRRNASVKEAATVLDLASQAVKRQRQQRRLEIMRRFFDVLLADLDYGVKDEKMTIAFLRFNRLREEMEMYEAHSEVDVLAHDTIYRDAFHIREQAGIQRLGARRHLGLAMGFTDYVPRDLNNPELSEYVDREVPEYEDMLGLVLLQSHEMIAAKLNLERAVNALEVIEKRYQPSLDVKLEATEWVQETGSRNAASIGLRFEVPLVSKSRKRRERKIGSVNVERARTKIAQVDHELRVRVFDLWRKLRLYQVELAAANVRAEFRDHYMDRSRALYELEESTDLGDAQAEQLRAFLELKRVEFLLTLAWCELDAMQGKAVYPN